MTKIFRIFILHFNIEPAYLQSASLGRFSVKKIYHSVIIIGIFYLSYLFNQSSKLKIALA